MSTIPEGKHGNEQNRKMNRAVPSPRIKELQRQIDELKRSWPAHSVPAAMLQQLEELEEELEMERKKFAS